MSTVRLLRPQGQSLAIVVFADSTLSYLKPLRPGYRHCMVATQSGGKWQLMDPLSNTTEITLLGDLSIRAVLHAFVSQGLDAVATQRQAPVMQEMPIAPFTCVEAVKRVLGLRDRWIVTPWQLRCALDHTTNKKEART